MKGPIVLIVVYTITTYIISTASDVNGPLARSGVTGGFLLLNVLALLNNYALLAAGDKAWQSAQWSERFMRRGQNLTDFLALSSSSGLAGWLGIIFHDLRLFQRIWRRVPGKLQQILRFPVDFIWRHRHRRAQTGAVRGTQVRRPSMTNARFWGLSRVGFWLFIQFPGLIFMTKVNPGIDYRPTNWEDISGGIGKYNASQAALKLSNGAYLSGLALNMIRDTTITKDWPAISPECKEKTNCSSYIIPGGLQTVTPWRYLAENRSSLPVYMTRATPVYQLDFWDGPAIVQWSEKDCTLFGMYGTTGIADVAFLICMTPHEDRKILAAFKYCNDKVTADGGCTYEGSWRTAATWNVIVAPYRREATVAVDRKSGELLDVKNLTKAEPQDITPADFLTAFNGFLYPFQALDISFACDVTGVEFQLTSWISNILDVSRTAAYQVHPREVLRNLFMVPLYFYNPMTSALGPPPSVTKKVDGLPSENYILGSYSEKVDLLTISRWTVVAYIIVCGLILFLILLVLALTAWNQVQQTSDFPFVDFLALKRQTVIGISGGSGAARATQDDIAGVFDNCVHGESGDIIEASRGVRVIPHDAARERARFSNVPP
ncbi:hypothetical protein ONS95_009565 [Cadophora gregata]|uniref:uncharacterized protein n=1 Tax=Cadophora gregata TaxID=51156 RepID=UPI0026DBF816|nr:uncharacterized protein ONS95_009565 [Cadophora gregata]KAK0124616.1 hypothetical protein ONS95_009565 [Cadophora gregata]